MPAGDSPIPFPRPHRAPDTGLRALVSSLWESTERARPELVGGLLAASHGLADVLDWAAQGAGSDETAAVWLQDFRWARALGLPLPDGAPAPPRDEWEDRLPAADASSIPPRLAAALTAEQMPYPARHDFPDLDDDSFFPRLVPLAVYPQDSVPHLGQLAVNLTALTHGSPEALATGLVWALLLRAALAPRADQVTEAAEQGDGIRPRGSEAVPVDDAQEALPRALETVRDLLLDRGDTATASSADRPASGLRAAMAATGSSAAALGRIIERAPLARAWLETAEHPAPEAPRCLRALARAVERVPARPAPHASATTPSPSAAHREDDVADWSGVLSAALAAGTGTTTPDRQTAPEPVPTGSPAVHQAAERWSAALERWAGL